MSVLNNAEAFTKSVLGQPVRRDAATIALDQDLFSVDGGLVAITSFIGRVTVAVGGGSQDIEIDFDPDDGGSNVALSTLLLIDADPVGTNYTLNATAGGALVEELDVAYGAVLAAPIVLGPGDIVLDVTGTEAGEIEWFLTYLPITLGATVSAV
jgi:hypothetical protein